MRSKTRTNDMIRSRILKACENGAKKTRITNQVSPNSIKLISFLLLIDEGLIEVVEEAGRIVHRTTPKGLGLIAGQECFHGEADKLTCLN
jgi:predicted transcriptional regulator